MLLSGLTGLWGHEMTPDLLIPLPVQSRLHQNCSAIIRPVNDTHSPNDTTWCSWSPFGKNGASCFPIPHSPPQEGLAQGQKDLFAVAAKQPAFSFSRLLSDQDNYKELLGAVDNAFLVAYAIGMFIR